jgi:hypothetical protein
VSRAVGDHADGTLIRVKAVPGASRDAVSGLLGDRVKVRVSAAPEGGKANKAIVRLLAGAIGCGAGQVELVGGQTHPEKLFAVRGIDAEQISDALGFDISPAVKR